MRIQGTFLGTRVARRMLLLFIVCGLLPSGLAILYAFTSVRSELQRQAQNRLKEYATISAATIADQLKVLDGLLSDVAASMVKSFEPDEAPVVDREPPEGFRSLVIQPGTPTRLAQEGSVAAPELTPENRERLSGAKPLLIVREDSLDTRLFLGRLLDPSDPGGFVLWGELDPDVLWLSFSSSARTTIAAGLCVFADTGQPLYCTLKDPEGAFSRLNHLLETRGEPSLRLDDAGDVHYAVYWSMFLGFEYGAGSWTILTSEPDGLVLAPLENFRRYFALILALAVAAVFLLANIQIRRTTEPLDELERATRRVAMGDLDTDVQVDSGDEFETLAHSFNAMTRRLHDQFTTLAAMAEVDRAVLSSLDLDEIIRTVLLNTRRVTGGEGAGLMLLDPGQGEVDAFVLAGDADSVTKVQHHPIAVEDIAALRGHPEGLTIQLAEGDGRRPGLVDLEPLAFAGLNLFWLLPLTEEETLYGALLVGHRAAEREGRNGLYRARQLADQVSVALSNARLVSELGALSEGTITALSRTIDAKSEWTAGHSDRVTNMALSLGDRLGLSQAERTTLHRGGMLHDIGKIGIPPGILDKPGKLTDEEMDLMRQHTVIGARILEPIGALASALPIVLYHHERFDGQGYPHGLAGENIPRLARILAVADVFDALASDRPYRKALSFDTAIEIIRDCAGTQFDPDVVRVFLEMVDEGEVHDRGYDVTVAALAS